MFCPGAIQREISANLLGVDDLLGTDDLLGVEHVKD
jgi:hypothetical protein